MTTPTTGTLHVVATPIGNVEDISARARRVLASVDVVACEDTRRTGRLLQRLGVEPPRLRSFFDQNERSRVPQLVALLGEGRDVALVTDAGTPGVSDPGYRLVAACVEAGVPVDVVPGPSAALAALVISGLPTDRFVFEGFLPRSGAGRRERAAAVAGETRTVVLFESPRRLAATLRDLLGAGADADRRAVVARELTKLHQEVLRGTLSSLAGDVGQRDLRGEVVLVIEGARPGPTATVDEAVAAARDLVRAGARKRDAARTMARATGQPARRIYEGLTRPER
jgi:16S rRNA (cytidine1402-2'-O)-methyltransferase